MRWLVWLTKSRLSTKYKFLLRLPPCAGSGRFERDTAMPNPKRRHSKQRTAKRRSHDFLTPTGLSECPNCHERKLPHRACRKCGTYKGREVLTVKEAS
jgi:large subunit ribosomal protein L32